MDYLFLGLNAFHAFFWFKYFFKFLLNQEYEFINGSSRNAWILYFFIFPPISTIIFHFNMNNIIKKRKKAEFDEKILKSEIRDIVINKKKEEQLNEIKNLHKNFKKKQNELKNFQIRKKSDEETNRQQNIRLKKVFMKKEKELKNKHILEIEKIKREFR